jgi:predicted nucleic acid-binding protein
VAETIGNILVLDASVLVNFLCIDRVDLLRDHPSQILLTEHVVDEITDAYPEQLVVLRNAIRDGVCRTVRIDDLTELEKIAKFRSGRSQLGFGECSAIVIAAGRGFAVACNDRVAISHARQMFSSLQIFKTEDLIVHLIKANVLNVPAADAIKETWEKRHKFRLKCQSFADLLD